MEFILKCLGNFLDAMRTFKKLTRKKLISFGECSSGNRICVDLLNEITSYIYSLKSINYQMKTVLIFWIFFLFPVLGLERCFHSSSMKIKQNWRAGGMSFSYCIFAHDNLASSTNEKADLPIACYLNFYSMLLAFVVKREMNLEWKESIRNLKENDWDHREIGNKK